MPGSVLAIKGHNKKRTPSNPGSGLVGDSGRGSGQPLIYDGTSVYGSGGLATVDDTAVVDC